MRSLLILLLLAASAEAKTKVLQKHCAACHVGDDAPGDFGFVDDLDRLIAEGLIVPGDAAGSPIFRRVENGEMPPRKVKARPSATEIAELRSWIDDLPPRPRRASRREVARELERDRDALAAEDRRWSRWILVGPGEEAALAKLLHSLTWSPSPHPLAARDGVVRIDLRDFGWSAAQWDAVLAAYPYGVAGVDAVRADWLIATASRPPLYDTLLGLPSTEAELERKVGVGGAPIRAGFTASGISAHNRVIERRQARHGAYWRSYDFASSTGVENVFEHPLDFVAAGGEIIFNLPNGLQGYMLVDAAGRKIDKAPTSIVTDARRPDRAVVNGLSCMGCHVTGILEKEDQVRATVALEEVRRIYRPITETGALMRLDATRFEQALAAVGADRPPEAADGKDEPADEPIGKIVAAYEADLDAGRAAAELDVTDLRGLRVGSLGVRGGAVKREVWEQEFARALRETGGGIPATLGGGGDDTRVWIDGAGRSWLLAPVSKATQRNARESCRALALELPAGAELGGALQTGLGGVISGTFWAAGTKLDVNNRRRAEIHDSSTGKIRLVAADERHDVVCLQR